MPVPPNSALQRAGKHKVLGRGRPSLHLLCGRWCARVPKRRRAVAELGSWSAAVTDKVPSHVAGGRRAQLNR